MDEETSRKQRGRQIGRLENLEVSPISLVDKPAIDIGFLVLKRHRPSEDEVPMARKKVEDEEAL